MFSHCFIYYTELLHIFKLLMSHTELFHASIIMFTSYIKMYFMYSYCWRITLIRIARILLFSFKLLVFFFFFLLKNNFVLLLYNYGEIGVWWNIATLSNTSSNPVYTDIKLNTQLRISIWWARSAHDIWQTLHIWCAKSPNVTQKIETYALRTLIDFIRIITRTFA